MRATLVSLRCETQRRTERGEPTGLVRDDPDHRVHLTVHESASDLDGYRTGRYYRFPIE